MITFTCPCGWETQETVAIAGAALRCPHCGRQLEPRTDATVPAKGKPPLPYLMGAVLLWLGSLENFLGAMALSSRSRPDQHGGMEWKLAFGAIAMMILGFGLWSRHAWAKWTVLALAAVASAACLSGAFLGTVTSLRGGRVMLAIVAAIGLAGWLVLLGRRAGQIRVLIGTLIVLLAWGAEHWMLADIVHG